MAGLTTRARRLLLGAAAVAAAAGMTVAGTVLPAAAAPAAGTAATARAGDTPPGFWWGTDSWPVPVSGSPYQMPKGLGNYGGYMGMTGSWSYWLGCPGGFLAWSSANSAQANANYARGIGVGTGAYWFLGGPGVDPHYNGTYNEALAWGQQQAARAVADANGQAVKYKVLWMDIELPGVAPAKDNGWNSVYTSPCSGKIRSNGIAASVDRAVFNGFYGYEAAHGYTPGVYSDAGVWASIFGTGSAASIPHTDEWTYEPETTNFAAAPSGWCFKGSSSCATFFGGVSRTSPEALMWQWSGGGGLSNGIGDFDQINGSRVK
ncbi:MAG: hypothetical protein JO016_05005 [Actinobacteria bacterium]|nr:hypothetical protein [Actinomycetota bacterium]